jgi:hypothetical protein
MFGVGDGNRTRNVRSHSPVLCQLSYSNRRESIITTRAEGGSVLRQWIGTNEEFTRVVTTVWNQTAPLPAAAGSGLESVPPQQLQDKHNP